MEKRIKADIKSHVEQQVKSQASSLEESISRINGSIEHHHLLSKQMVQSSIDNHTKTLDEKLTGHVSSIVKEISRSNTALLEDVHARSIANMKESFEARLDSLHHQQDSINKKIEQSSITTTDMDRTSTKEALVPDETFQQAVDSQVSLKMKSLEKEVESKIAAIEDNLDSRIESILEGELNERVHDRILESVERELKESLVESVSREIKNCLRMGGD